MGKRVFVRRREHERLKLDCVVPTVKFGGGKVMVWRCMSSEGVGLLAMVKGSLNAAGYLDILSEHMLPSAAATFPAGEWFYQQDNAPCHKARTVTACFENQHIEVLPWPPQSPDLNPIEHLWDVIFKRLNGRRPGSADILWQMLEQEWNSITPEVCRNLVSFTPRRVAAVLRAKGGYSKY